MSDDDVKFEEMVDAMRDLQPIRNINALKVWITAMRPQLLPIYDLMINDAVVGKKPAVQFMLFMMAAFAAGRVYQKANPLAPRDPDGYGG